MLMPGAGTGMEGEAAVPHRLQDAVESTAAKVITRVVVPILLAIIGFFVIRLVAEQDTQGDDIVAIKQAQAVTNTLLAERVIRQIDTNTAVNASQQREINDLKTRVSVLERSK